MQILTMIQEFNILATRANSMIGSPSGTILTKYRGISPFTRPFGLPTLLALRYKWSQIFTATVMWYNFLLPQKRILLFYFICITAFSTLYGQATLRGRVFDADTNQPLVGAAVSLATLSEGRITDSVGMFRFDPIPSGRYQLTISYLGYQEVVLNEVLVASGKEQVLEIALMETSTSLALVTVKGSRVDGSNTGGNVVRLTQEETLRFPATFNDPGRLSMAFAGVAGANDQANHLIVRGQSPLGNHWRLEGMEIVNPNHRQCWYFLRPYHAEWWRVNAVSSQLLEDARLYLGAFPANYGNATASIMDMYLREGNNETQEYTLQAGLIGFDAAAECLSKKEVLPTW
ncbi:MAG: carboxypeptidase-like regulatory domain-containing protein [Saprospiraceae bacterium]